MIARRLPSILPAMTREEAIDVTRIYSAAGLSPPEGLVRRRPFRAPHHTASAGALAGGGTPIRPGEISLAHRGVLFLDELPEFSRAAIETLRQPLEERVVRINRVRHAITMPASFLLVASANPCPCGWLGCEARACTCPVSAVERYRARLSGPLLDRIDLQVRVDFVPLHELRGPGEAEPSAPIRARVEAARERQAARLRRHRARLNGEMSPRAARATCRVTDGAERALDRLLARKSGMSARSIDRIVRVARTIADLEERDDVAPEHVLEAAAFRAFDTEPLVDPRVYLPRDAAARG